MIKLLILLFMLVSAPVYSEEIPEAPDIGLLTKWDPLPDGTMILEFYDSYYRHHILSSRQKTECSEVIIGENVVALITRPNFQTWEYIISKKPVFYSKDGKVWIWVWAILIERTV